jgi:transposase InsO family protein
LLRDVITEIHAASRGTYGTRRVRAALFYERGLVVNRKLVRKLMRQAGLEGLPKRKGRRNLVRIATQEDLVNRNFSATSPNRLWLTDVTEHNSREGTLYCCVVLDHFSGLVVGWSIVETTPALSMRHWRWPRELARPQGKPSCTPITARASSRGRSPRTCDAMNSSVRWAPSAIASTTPPWSHFGDQCRLNS